MTVSWRYYLLFMTEINDHCGCMLPTNVIDKAMCYINIRFAQSTTQTLIGGELKTTLAFIHVPVSWHCRVNKLRVWRWADLSLDVLSVISCSCEWTLNLSLYARYDWFYSMRLHFQKNLYLFCPSCVDGKYLQLYW